MKLIIISLFVIFFIVLIPCANYANGMKTINEGRSFPVGYGSEKWNTGFSIGVNWFQPFLSNNPNLLAGGRFAYNRWTPNAEKLTRSSEDMDWSVSGFHSVFEFVPSIRYFPNQLDERQKVKVFGQLGFGYFLLKSETKVIGSYGSSTDRVETSTSVEKFGLCLGSGLVIGNNARVQLEFLPLYYIIYTEDETTKYLTLNLGVAFK